MNGLIPLVMTSVLEFENEDEVTATLVYEKLEKHCFVCLMLDHEKQDCVAHNNVKQLQQTEVSAYQSPSKKGISVGTTRSREMEEKKREYPQTRTTETKTTFPKVPAISL